MLRDLVLLPALLALLFCFASAGTSPKKVVAARLDSSLVIDGILSETQWQAAVPVADFTQFDPAEGASPTESTLVRMLYDDHALYIGVLCRDRQPEGIVRQLIRRDRSSEADRFTVMIDSHHDHQTAFVFSTNVSGVQTDGVLSQDGTAYDVTWDAVWDVRTNVNDRGWSAEFVIPYDALRFSEEQHEYEWGINFRRYISRKKETIEWVMVPRNERLQISRWGHLRGVSITSPPLHLEMMPYVSGSLTQHPANEPWSHATDYRPVTGLDIKYGVSRNFTLDATIHPDFGQVEVDQAVLNLSVFETFFPEKRPFFIEGARMFDFGTAVDLTPLSVFFSRRIGRQPRGGYGVMPPLGGSIETNPAATAILGAAKLTGRTSSGLSIGALAAATDEEHATVRDAAGGRSNIVTEPRGGYAVARVKQDFGTSWIGAIGTLVTKQTLLPAVAGGVDWNIRFNNDTYTSDGYIAGAMSSTATREREGAAGRLLFSRIAAEHWFPTMSYDFASRNFNINDAGFFARPHDHGGYFQMLYRETFGTGLFRHYSLSVVPEARWNWDGIRTKALNEVLFAGEFMNFWRLTLAYDLYLNAYDDAERGIAGIYRRPVSHLGYATVTTDERKSLSASLTAGGEVDLLKKRNIFSTLALTVRPASWMELTPSLYYQRTRNEQAGILSGGWILQTVRPEGTYSVFGDRNVDELDVAMRGIVTFSRTLSLQFFTQALLARGTYKNYRRLVAPATFVMEADQSPNYDFNEATLNANVLLRWEYLPGSTLYLVWTQSRYGDSMDYLTGFSQRFNETFTLPHEDVLLLKISYWLPM